MNIAKLILHYNTPELTLSLCAMVPDAIVIDNGSDIDMRTLLPSERVMRFESNKGFTANWNRAIKKIMKHDAGYYQAFWLMNSDIEIGLISIQRMEQLMQEHPYSMVTPSYNCWMKQCKNNGSPGIRQVKCIEFTAPVIRRDVFDSIGFFDERFSKGYGVEFDWSLRMQAAGLLQYCDDQSFFYHVGQRTIHLHSTLMEYESLAKAELHEGMEFKYGPDWKARIMASLDVFNEKPSKKRVAVYTTIFGDYNHLLPVMRQTVQADFYCITDNLDIDQGTTGRPAGQGHRWKIIPVDYPSRDLPSRLRAKFFKLFPWEAYTLDQYDIMIYIDGSIGITSPDFVRHCLDSLGDSDMALYAHPVRNCIYDEAVASKPLVKYLGQNIDGQISYYNSIYPRHGGLFACGVMVRRIQSLALRDLMGKWWWEILKWTYQDQLSFPVVCKLSKFTPGIIPGNQNKNEFFKIFWHDDLVIGPQITNS
jgi:hypothetical protein